MYTIGELYTRNDIYDLLSLPEEKRRGDWLNGYHRHENDYYIFCNIGVAGRTGHDYDNHWEGDKLIWYGKTKSHFAQTSIKHLLSPVYRILVFYREDSRAAFTFAGIGTPDPHYEVEFPARIDWSFEPVKGSSQSAFTDELTPVKKGREGHRVQVLVNRYERDRNARDSCIRYYGAHCKCCDLDFEKEYGDIGKGFIHVHHIVPLSSIDEEYEVDPITDLVPVCPNCHAMLHKRKPPITVEELRSIRQHVRS